MAIIEFPEKYRMGRIKKRYAKGNKARWRISEQGGGVAGAVVPPPFSPDDVSGLLGWWRADDLALNDNDPVASWTDLSAEANHLTQGTAANRPVLKESIINAHDVVRFDGSNDVLTATDNSPSGNNARYFFFVVTLANIAAVRTLFGYGAAANDNLCGARIDTGGDVLFYFFSDDLACNSNLTTATPYLLSFWFTGAAKSMRVNGVEINAHASTTNTTAGPMAIGTDAISAATFAGDIAEILLYGSGPSAGDLDDIEAYLMDRYAL